MPMWAPGRCERERSAGGFTLIEILLVMALIAIAASVMVLSIGDTADSRIREDARTLGRFFNRVADEAAVTGDTLRVIERDRRFEVVRPANGEIMLQPLSIEARTVSLTLTGRSVPPGTPIPFPPAAGDSFDLVLDYRGARFHVGRDALGRIAVQAGS